MEGPVTGPVSKMDGCSASVMAHVVLQRPTVWLHKSALAAFPALLLKILRSLFSPYRHNFFLNHVLFFKTSFSPFFYFRNVY
jgi:hypothetical protein